MERRRVLQAGLALGTTFVGERLSESPAEARPLKVARTFYEGTIQTNLSYYSGRLRLAVVGKRVIGFAFPYLSYIDRDPVMRIIGSVKNKKLRASLIVVTDPQERVPPKTEVGTIQGTVSGAKAKGLLSMPGLPDSRGETEGRFETPKMVEDKAAMKELAGVYDGAVVGGMPEFKSVATLGKNGTYVLSDIRRPDGTSVKGRYGGVYLVGEPLNDGERLVYSLPLPTSANAAALAALALAVDWCECCGETEADQKAKEEAKRQQAEGAARMREETDRQLRLLYRNSSHPLLGSFGIEAKRR